jgi:tetratricopeptide (TPR) repeat protein
VVLILVGVSLIPTVQVYPAAKDENPSELVLQMIEVSARSEADEIFERLERGDSFEEIARERSTDPTSAQGGYLGKTRLSAFRPEIREALRGVPAGQVTQVVKTPSGYMILKVLAGAEIVETENTRRGRPPMQIPSADGEAVTEVSGGYEAQYFFNLLEKPSDWNQNLQTICELKLRAVGLAIERIESNLAGLKNQNLEQRYFEIASKRHHTLAQLYSYRGEMKKAIEHFQSAYQLAASHHLKEFQLELEEKLGIAEMRRGEIENCLNNHNAKSCIFPISREGQYKLESGSREAIKHFLNYLTQKPQDIEVKWLLNVAYMTLGEYPNHVPHKYLIPPGVFESREDIGRFVDVAPSVGLDVYSQAGGVILEDFDNDGFLDIVTSSMDACEPLHYFHNNGDGTFSDRTAWAGLSKQLGGLNLIQADYNNDGCMDILVLRGAWELPMRKSLLRNNCDGTFTDVTAEAGLANPATSTQTAAWADFDNDGNIDLFVGNENAPSQLFHNNGDGTFTDVAHHAGVDRVAFTKGVVAGDYDNDGYPDFYVSNGGDENYLYHNNRDGTFTDVARKLHVEKPSLSFAVWFFDYNNDGWLDLFVTSFLQSVTEVARSYLQLPGKAETLRLYKNTGKGSFQDVTREVGLNRVFMPMGANFGDVDNDGFLDFYLGTGAPSYAALVPNVLFRNHDGKYFVDITTSSGTGHLQKGHGIAFGDINNDGDEDIVLEIGGAVPGDKYPSVLFRNPGHHGNNWISLRLVGVKTNRAAIGARIKLTLQNGDHGRRFIYRDVTSGGSFGASPLQQHIGLGKAPRIETLEVWWPTSNTRQIFHNVSPNQFIEIEEFGKNFVKQNRRSFPLRESDDNEPHLGRHHMPG